MKYKILKLKYNENAILNYFAPISYLPWSILLHSGNSNHRLSRFDIMVADPVVKIITKNNYTKIYTGKKVVIKREDPFQILQEQLEIYGMKNINYKESIPFNGGAVGFFGYDLVKRIEKIPSISKKDINLPDMAIGIYQWALIADNINKSLTLVSNINLDIVLKFIYSKRKYVNKPFFIEKPWESNINREEYSKNFKKIKNLIMNGMCYQVCFAQRFHTSYIGNEWLAFYKLLNYNRAPFSAFIRINKLQTIISVSPERFLHLRKNKLETSPIKGTIARIDKSLDKKQIFKLKNSEKDMAENLMIVDLMRNDIGKLAVPGSVYVSNLFSIETFRNVHHMVSTIHGDIPETYTPVNIFRSCFPGGSVTGAPKIQAMKIIENTEKNCRSAWCGSIGYISYCGAMDTNISIRTLITDNKKIYCYVGGGIVYDSDEESEYQETISKASSLIPILNLKK